MKKAILSLILVCFIILASACSGGEATTVADNNSSELISNLLIEDEEPSEDKTTLLSQGFLPKAKVQKVSLNGSASKTGSFFSYELFKTAYSEKKNTLISPISIMYALAMAQNGADGETLKQIENAFGCDRNTLNVYLKSYLSALDENLKLNQSMWVYPQGQIKDSFLQTNADYFDSEIYSTPMDSSSLYEMNKWVENKTDGEIKKAVDSIPPNTDIFLINATLFDAKWEKEYKKLQVREGNFYNLDNTISKPTFLYSTEHTYLSGEGFSGFCKAYDGGRFYFTALLPDENSSLSELVSSLDGNDFSNLIKNASYENVSAAIPEFQIDFKTDLIPILKKLGIEDAFDGDKADFSDMGGGELYLAKALHNTSIKLDRNGTKAAASTAIAGATKGGYTPPKVVYLDRPFLYAIYDTQADMPIFIGTVTSLK